MLACSAIGSPDPSITWLKDYIPVDLTDPRVKQLPTGAQYLNYLPCKQLLVLIAYNCAAGVTLERVYVRM